MTNNSISQRLIPVACDPGNDTLKIIVNGNIRYIRTILQKAYEARCIFGGDKGDPLDFLDVDLCINGSQEYEHYFAASLARTGNIIESKGGFKSSNTMLIKSMIIGMAASLAIEFPEENTFKIKLGTGLPAHEFFYKDDKKQYSNEKINEFKKNISGQHKMKFNTTLLGRREVTLDIPKEEIEMLPECFAPLNYLISKLQREKKLSTEEKLKGLLRRGGILLGLDIGGGSSDSAGIKDGSFYTEAMFGINRGINNALDKACRDLTTSADLLSFTRSDFVNVLFDDELKGNLYTSKKEYDLNAFKAPYYEETISKIADEYLTKLNNQGISTSFITGLILLGGGGNEASELITKALSPDIKNIIRVSDYVDDPRALTALAYYEEIVGEQELEAVSNE